MTDPDAPKKIKRHTVSDLDGMQQGGLAVILTVFVGVIVAASLVPGSLTSFWVWFALLMLAVAVGSGVQQVFAREEVEHD